MHSIRTAISFTALALVFFLAACSSGGYQSGLGIATSGGTGVLQVHLTDAPIDLSTVENVVVIIDEVKVYPADDEVDGPVVQPVETDTASDTSSGGPISIMDHPKEFDLLTLTAGATDLLAQADLPAGSYSRIRLGVASAFLIFTDTTREDLKIESHKVDIPIRFEIIRDQVMAVVLDFEADASVQVNQTGNDKYILRPVVTPVGMAP